MMGAPLTADAVSKVWLMDGAATAGMGWAVWVLWTSSLFNAAYSLPILWRVWLKPLPVAWPDEHIAACGRRETAWLLLIPPLVTASAVLAAGIFSDTA